MKYLEKLQNFGKTSSAQKYCLSNQWRNGGETNDLQFSEFVNMINQVFQNMKSRL